MGPYGLPGDDSVGLAASSPVAVPAPADAGRQARSAEPAAPDHSGTNTYEAGADEPDLVKTDGRRVVAISRGVLRVVDTATRTVTGSLALPGNLMEPTLLLAGDHALVLTTSPGAGPPGRSRGPWSSAALPTRLLLVDLSGAPRVVGRYTIDASLVDARQVGSVARVVVRSTPDLRFPIDRPGGQDARIAANHRVIDAAPVQAWLPRYDVGSGSVQRTGRVDCRAVSRPRTYSGSALLTVLTFDLSRSTLDDGSPASLVADGATVYSNGPSLYVATDNTWRAWGRPWLGQDVQPVAQRTEVYKFDISGTGRPRYVAGGSVPGWLVNQYAMSEWNGQLRIATTVGQGWERATKSESTVYVLGSSLQQLGKVGGLGKGERIYAVRFIGPTGYVVTFRQVDPLYTVDLRDPDRPKVTGELKISGYSAYLHPAGDGRLIGVGQDADNAGRRGGVQVSLFDVRDPAHASRVAQYAVPGGYSEAELDPHAFLHWPATGLLVVPVTSLGGPATPDRPAALALRVTDMTITDLGGLHQRSGEPIRRSMVIGDALWTLSDSSLSIHSLATLAPVAEIWLS